MSIDPKFVELTADVLIKNNFIKCWSVCANECLRSHVSGDIDILRYFDLLLMLGAAQKLPRNFCCTPLLARDDSEYRS